MAFSSCESGTSPVLDFYSACWPRLWTFFFLWRRRGGIVRYAAVRDGIWQNFVLSVGSMSFFFQCGSGCLDVHSWISKFSREERGEVGCFV